MLYKKPQPEMLISDFINNSFHSRSEKKIRALICNNEMTPDKEL